MSIHMFIGMYVFYVIFVFLMKLFSNHLPNILITFANMYMNMNECWQLKVYREILLVLK